MHDAPLDSRAILDLESKRWTYEGRKEHAIREQLGITATRYYQLLNELLDNPPADLAIEFGPILNRLRRMREQRVAQRSASRRTA